MKSRVYESTVLWHIATTKLLRRKLSRLNGKRLFAVACLHADRQAHAGNFRDEVKNRENRENFAVYGILP